MDKSWISMPRNTPEYVQGLNKFLDFAFERNSGIDHILCPCRKCGFKKLKIRDEVFADLLRSPFPIEYTVWYRHGESRLGESSQSLPILGEEVHCNANPMINLVTDAFRAHGDYTFEDTSPLHEPLFEDDMMSDLNEESNVEAKRFCQLLKDGEEVLYPGCKKFTKLSFLIRLYNIKSLCRITDKAMSMLIDLLSDAFEFANIPKSEYEAKKVMRTLGLSYTEIHACPKDCMLYWGSDANRKSCKVCGRSRYKLMKNDRVGDKKRKEQATKIFRYFPLIPRLQRLFACSKTAENMVWHSKDKKNDGIARHPRDSEAWKNFDVRYPDFASDPRNVRLGLASDGFNPNGSLGNNYSIWPIVLIPYNNPPWLCMKQTNFILSGIIPGKKMPGNDIDVYMQPMIEELKTLWEEGVETYDASKNEVFKLRATLMWTVSDFPALGNLTGWNIYTGLACPTCNFDARPLRLPCSKKWCFMGSRRFLDKGHKFRLNRVQFDGHIEDRDPPKRMSGSEILKQVEHVHVTFGKHTSGRKRNRADLPEQWKKKSIFFQLSYWEFNLLRHNLDVMHIEKNVCDNIIYTLLNDKDKRKDHLNARKDLIELNIRGELWPKEDGKTCPAALFTLKKQEIDVMLETLKDISVPDGYSSNISECVDLSARKLSGLKSHDSHVLLQDFLPLAVRNIMPIQVSSPLVELSSCFKLICSKVVNTSELDNLQKRISLCLCHLEMFFPPSFFTVMVHLVIHLVEELRLGGPVHYRWMYPIERFLGNLKSHVGNKARPEGSIAEWWRSEEIISFASLYLEMGVEERFNRGRRVNDKLDDSLQLSSSLFPCIGKPVGGAQPFNLSDSEILQASRHVLINCTAANRFIQEFRDITKKKLRNRTRSANEIDKAVHRGIVDWFKTRILNDNVGSHSKDLKALARGPMRRARKFSAYDINGYRFRTLVREQLSKTSNSGVFGSFGTNSYASSSDMRPVQGLVPYYGRLVDIIELNYYGNFSVTLFKCEWANTINPRCMKKDALGFTSINFSHLIHTGDRDDDEPFIKADEAQMVYYVEDKMDKGWSIPVHIKPRDLYDMGSMEGDTVYESEAFPYQDLASTWVDGSSQVQLSRLGVEVEFE